MAKMKKSIHNSKMSERDFLIEQCLLDAYCERTGRQLDEGLIDNIKAGAAGAWAGAKQKVKNTGKRISNAASNIKKMAGNAKKIANAGSSYLMGNKEAGNKQLASVDSMTNLNAGTANATGAKNLAKIKSYVKSITSNLDALQKVTAEYLASTGSSNPQGDAQQLIDKVRDAISELPVGEERTNTVAPVKQNNPLTNTGAYQEVK